MIEQPHGYRHGQTTVLGLDPSMTSTGYAVIRGDELVGAGKIQTSPDDSEPFRVWVVFSEVLEVIREFDVDHAAIEQFTAFYRNGYGSSSSDADTVQEAVANARGNSSHNRSRVNPRSMFLMKAAQTATQTAVLVGGCRTFLYKVAEWKGGQRVSKEAIRDRAQMIYGVPTKDHNITDAVMIAHHHIHTGRLNPNRGLELTAEQLERAQNLFAGTPETA